MNRLEYKQKKRRLHKRIKIPVWVSTGVLILIIAAVSAAVSYTVTDRAMDRLIRQLPHPESEYITETGRYPDWFIEWQNTVYWNGGEK